MARNNGPKRGTGRKTFAIIVDGETELWYLQKLRDNEALKGVAIKPELPRKKTLAEQFADVKSNTKTYDHSIWIIDLDVVIATKAVGELESYIAEIRENDKIDVLVNTPCLEFWFLMHVKDTGKYYELGNLVERDLKKTELLKDYAKSQKYFVNNNPDIYKRLRPLLAVGIANATKRGEFDPKNPEQALAELYKLFSILGITP